MSLETATNFYPSEIKLRLRQLKIYLLSKCKNEEKEVLSTTFQADRYRLDLSLTLLTRLYEKIPYFRSNFKYARSNFKDGTEFFWENGAHYPRVYLGYVMLV